MRAPQMEEALVKSKRTFSHVLLRAMITTLRRLSNEYQGLPQ